MCLKNGGAMKATQVISRSQAPFQNHLKMRMVYNIKTNIKQKPNGNTGEERVSHIKVKIILCPW